jgi:hypothetical protein
MAGNRLGVAKLNTSKAVECDWIWYWQEVKGARMSTQCPAINENDYKRLCMPIEYRRYIRERDTSRRGLYKWCETAILLFMGLFQMVIYR